MPRVHEEDGFEIRIYLPPREHEPPHVHVLRAGGEVVINLGAEGEAPEIREVHGMRDREALRAYRIVEEQQASLLEKWREYHG